MSKISMMQVYSRIEAQNRDLIISSLRSKKTEISYNYEDFKRDMMRNDFIASYVTIQKKWDTAVLDQILIQVGKEPRSRGMVYIPYLLHTLRLEKKYEQKNVSLFYIAEAQKKRTASVSNEGGSQ